MKWFGVKGDAWDGNPSPTDDTAAIQLSIDTLQTLLGTSNLTGNQTISESTGDLYFPAGFYSTRTITINSISSGTNNEIANINFIGAGIMSTVFVGRSQYFLAPPGSGATVSIPINVIPIINCLNQNTTFKDFAIKGNYIPLMEPYGIIEDSPSGYYYWLGPGFENIGINVQGKSVCNFERISIVGCSIGINILGNVFSNVTQCIFGSQRSCWALDSSNHWVSHSFELGNNFGIYIDRDPNAPYSLANKVSVFESRFYGNHIWGIYFANGSMLQINVCDFEPNGDLMDSPFIGNPNTGAICIAQNITEMRPPLIVNITGTWFERNLGYTIYYNSDGAVIFNLNNCYFLGTNVMDFSYGVLIDTVSPTSTDIKKVNILGCYSDISTNSGSIVGGFVLDIEEANIIGSTILYQNINSSAIATNTQFYKIP